MKALILAGGFGTRLRPLTYTRPKHLLPIANEPHIEHVFDLLQRHGIDEIVLLTSYLAEQFRDLISVSRQRGLRFEVTHEEEPLGTAGALRNASEFVGDETFLAFNGDILTDVDLSELIDFHGATGAEATLMLVPVEDPSAFGVVPTDDEGKVLGFVEKPPPEEATTNLINAGIYVFEPKVLDRIPAGRAYSAERELFPEIVASGAMYARGVDAYWMDIGTPEKYLQANLDALEGRFRTAAVPQPGPGESVGLEGAQISPGGRVSSSCLGPGVIVEDGGLVERSVLLSGAVVCSGAMVADSVLGEGAKVAAGVELRGRAVADRDVVES